MSAQMRGVEPHTTNEENPQAKVDVQELAPDPPPRAVDATGEVKPRRPRGFAAMDRKLVSEIARKGGKAAHSAGTAHEFTSDEARDAGRKGGRATHAKRREAQGLPAEQQAEKAES
jgi:general stress protein YciG